jgi:polar amino acid transport system ATP-binding protein
MIIIDNVTKTYGALTVLNKVSLNIEQGQTVIIAGPSGSGKSTLLRCINNLEAPTFGRILVNGMDSTDPILFKKIGMVFQHFHLFPHMNVLDNLIYAPIKVLKIKREVAIEQAHELLNKISLLDKVNNFPHNLSGGQKQRVAIARTLMMQPEIILFDEPTSALDPEMVKEVQDVIKSLAHTGITIIIVSHEMSFARKIADRILFFDQGKLIEDSIPEQFFNNPTSLRAQVFLANLTLN